MHPDIKKFWEDNGQKIQKELDSDNIIYWETESDVIIAKQKPNQDIKYYKSLDMTDNELYSEAEMLKLIKIKAFW